MLVIREEDIAVPKVSFLLFFLVTLKRNLLSVVNNYIYKEIFFSHFKMNESLVNGEKFYYSFYILSSDT